MARNSYSFSLDLPGIEHAEAADRVAALLEEEGFEIVFDIDIRETLRQKLDVEYPRYVILGSCHPELAHRALAAEIGAGVLLPANVVVTERQGGGVAVMAVDPMILLHVIDNPHVDSVAWEARQRLQRVFERLADERSDIGKI